LYNTLFCVHCVPIRGEAEDNLPIINVNGVDDKDFVVINEDGALPTAMLMRRISPLMQVKVRKVLMLVL
jgi:hypothetical protein